MSLRGVSPRPSFTEKGSVAPTTRPP